MTAKTYEDWWKNGLAAAIPWLAGGPNGQAEAGAWPRLIDDILRDRVTQARYQCFAGLCASDALPHLGGDRRLIRGSNELEANFRARLQNPWDQWARAGTWLGMLCQLYWFGITNAVIVQQNGLQATLTGAPVIGVDPTPLYSVTDTAVLSSTLTSTVDNTRSIPAGTPWFYFDGDTDHCSRFAIILPSFPFARLGYATFSNTDSAIVTWPVPFPDANYGMIPGVPGAPVVLNIDGSFTSTTQAKVLATAPWTGRVPVFAWETGVNPFNLWSSTSSGLLKTIIQNWRPNAWCTGVSLIQTGGRTWDYFPPGTTWDGGTYPTWDTNTYAQIIGAF